MALTELVSPSFALEGRFGTAFQWGGTIFCLLLLILNRTAQQSSSLQGTLLFFYLFTSLPNFLFNIFRGWFGSWLSFAATAANLMYPDYFPVARFVLFVVVPDSITNGLRGMRAGPVFCLAVALLLVPLKLRSSLECGWHNFWYFVCVAILLYCSISSL